MGHLVACSCWSSRRISMVAPGWARSRPSGEESTERTTLGGVGLGAQGGGVDGGELEAVEEGGGATGLQVSGGEGVDDDGEGDLDGFAVFEGGELDVLAGEGGGVAEAAVALVEAVVEVAPYSRGEGGGFAAGSVGLDVAAEWVLHGSSPWGVPPGGYLRGSSMTAMR
jgi:hypothetical protein